MDEHIKEILDSLPPKQPRSRLEPYRELIREMRRRGRTYREIAEVLGTRCQVQVSPSAIHEYVSRRARPRPAVAVLPEEAGAGDETLAGSAAEASERPAKNTREPAKRKSVFTYDENEPLRVTKARTP